MNKWDVLSRILVYGRKYKRISTDEFTMGDAPYNYMCHMNAVQHVKDGTAEKVIACYAIDTTDNSQCIHFINQLSDGKYQDNTWGWRYRQFEYYLIKEVSKEEMEHIWNVLNDLKKDFVFQNSNWLERKLFRINYKQDI